MPTPKQSLSIKVQMLLHIPEPFEHGRMRGRKERSNGNMYREAHVIVLGQFSKVIVHLFIAYGITWICRTTKTDGKSEDEFASLERLLRDMYKARTWAHLCKHTRFPCSRTLNYSKRFSVEYLPITSHVFINAT
jgi:hypothetical protein